MATDLQTILSWFKTGLKPTQAQFWASWSSFWHKDEAIPQSSVSGLTNVLNAKVENDQFNAYKAANDALILGKEDKTKKGAPNGYAPLDEFTKLAAQYLNIVNDLVTGGSTALLSAEQGKVLQTQISAINTLLTSDNVNLDTVQELVDAIETVQLSLSSILVNDLTTGGTTKALTAEMGKQLDLIKESTANKSTSIVADYLSNIKFPSVKAVYDFCMLAFRKKFLVFGDVAGITHIFGAGAENTMFKFSNNNPITATIPTNATTPFDIGTVFETIATGDGALTVTGAPGVTILTNLSNTSVKNEVRRYTKIDIDTWAVEGNNPLVRSDYYYIDSVNGSDTTGEVGNPLKPYKLTQAVLAALPSISVDAVRTYTLVYMNEGTHVMSQLPARNLCFSAKSTATILSFSTIDTNIIVSGIINATHTYQNCTITNTKSLNACGMVNTGLNLVFDHANVTFLYPSVFSILFDVGSISGVIKKLTLGDIATFVRSYSIHDINRLQINEIAVSTTSVTSMDLFSTYGNDGLYDIIIKNITGTKTNLNIFKLAHHSKCEIFNVSLVGTLADGDQNINTTINFNNSIFGATTKFRPVSDCVITGMTHRDNVFGIGTDYYGRNGSRLIFLNFSGKVDFIAPWSNTIEVVFANCNLVLTGFLINTLNNQTIQNNAVKFIGTNTFLQLTPGDLIRATTPLLIEKRGVHAIQTNALQLGANVTINSTCNNIL